MNGLLFAVKLLNLKGPWLSRPLSDLELSAVGPSRTSIPKARLSFRFSTSLTAPSTRGRASFLFVPFILQININGLNNSRKRTDISQLLNPASREAAPSFSTGDWPPWVHRRLTTISRVVHIPALLVTLLRSTSELPAGKSRRMPTSESGKRIQREHISTTRWSKSSILIPRPRCARAASQAIRIILRWMAQCGVLPTI